MDEPTAARDHVDRFIDSLDLDGIDPLVEGIANRLIGLGRRLQTSLDHVISTAGLSLGDWAVLTTLREAGPPYRRSAGQLAARAQRSSGTMTSRLDRLEAAGLVRRLRDPDDRRGVLVELTDAGLAAWQRAADAQLAEQSIVVEVLDDAERERLNGLLRQLMLAFEAREAAGRRRS
jgi:DNA-binding MarR family transcriptional regulator